jgi:hypothetical protein
MYVLWDNTCVHLTNAYCVVCLTECVTREASPSAIIVNGEIGRVPAFFYRSSCYNVERFLGCVDAGRERTLEGSREGVGIRGRHFSLLQIEAISDGLSGDSTGVLAVSQLVVGTVSVNFATDHQLTTNVITQLTN